MKFISHRERLFKQKKNEDRIKRVYNISRNCITREIKKAKKEYYKNYFHDNINNMKNILNINKKGGSPQSELLHRGKNINNNKDKVNSFNEIFTAVGPNLNKQIPNSNILRNPNVHPEFLILCYTPPLLRILVKSFLH